MSGRRSGFARTSVVLLAGALVAIVGLAVWLLRPGDGSSGPPKIELAKNPRLEASAEAATAASPTTPTRELTAAREAVPAPPATPEPPRTAPESYTRELAGLHGRVIEENGKPVPNLPVELLRLQLDDLLTSVEGGFAEPPPELIKPDVSHGRTADDGTFELRDIEVGSLAILGIDLGGPRGTARLLDVALERGQSLDLGDLILLPHVTFTGTLLDEDGAPIANGRIRVLPQLPWPIPTQVLQVGIQDIRTNSAALIDAAGLRMAVEMPGWLRSAFERLPIPTTATLADGTFQLPGVPAGLVTVIADHEGFVGLVRAGVPTGRREQLDVGTLRLSRGRHITGQVLAGEAPVAGAHLFVGALISLEMLIGNQGMVALGQPTGATDASGHFALDGVPEGGDLLCAIQSQPGDPWLLLGPFDHDDVKIELPAVTTLNVAVQDGKSEPVTGAELRFLEETPLAEFPFYGQPRPLPGRVKEIAPGRYTVNSLPAGKWHVLARAEGYGIGRTTTDLQSGEATAVITLPGAAAVDVRVSDAATHAPVDFALVAAMTGDDGAFFSTTFKTARTDPQGAATLQQLPSGRKTTIRVTHPGYVIATQKVPKEPGANAAPLEIALQRGGDLLGRVSHQGDPPGKPLMLTLTFEGEKTLPDQEMPHFALTLPDGTFRVRHLAAGDWRYLVYGRFLAVDPIALTKSIITEPDELADGKFQIEEGKETTLEIDALPEGALVAGVVRGVVRIDGEPVEKAQVQLSGRRWLNAETDATGHFELTDVKPGNYDVHVQCPREHGSTTLQGESFQLGSGEQKELRIEARLVTRAFLVRARDGSVAAKAAIHCTAIDADKTNFGGNGTYGTTDLEGAATLALPGGRFRVTAKHESLGRATIEIDATGASDRPIEIVLDPGITVIGKVVFDRPPSSDSGDRHDRWNLMITLNQHADLANYSSEDTGEWLNIDPADPKFELHNVLPGHYTAMLWASGFGGRSPPTVEFDVTPAGATDLVLRFKSE